MKNGVWLRSYNALRNLSIPKVWFFLTFSLFSTLLFLFLNQFSLDHSAFSLNLLPLFVLLVACVRLCAFRFRLVCVMGGKTKRYYPKNGDGLQHEHTNIKAAKAWPMVNNIYILAFCTNVVTTTTTILFILPWLP